MSSKPRLTAKYPLAAEKPGEKTEYPGIVPEIAAPCRRRFRRARTKQTDEFTGRARRQIFAARCCRHAAKDVFVQPWIRQLHVGAAHQQPLLRSTERLRRAPRVRANTVHPGLLRAEFR